MFSSIRLDQPNIGKRLGDAGGVVPSFIQKGVHRRTELIGQTAEQAVHDQQSAD